MEIAKRIYLQNTLTHELEGFCSTIPVFRKPPWRLLLQEKPVNALHEDDKMDIAISTVIL